MWDDEYAGHYCLLIAIFCDLNADEARKMYEYGPDHPLCKKIMSRKVRKEGLDKLNREESGTVMKELLTQGYSVNAISDAFQCFPSTVKRRIRNIKDKGEEEDDDPA